MIKLQNIRAIGYEIFIDPLLKKTRGQIANFIPQDSSIIDIGCGSGALAFHLAESKNCTVHGIDLATEKITRANKRKANINSQKVHFSKADASNLAEISDQQFDCATMSLFVHSLPENIRHKVIKEAMRVAKLLVIADYVTKQPLSIPSIAVKGIERIAGSEHFQGFNSFKANGGLEPLLEKAGLKITNEQVNSNGTIRIILAEKPTKD